MSLEEALAGLGLVVERRPFAYATSWPIEEVVLEPPGGGRLSVLVKWMTGEVQKPPGLLDPDREASVYRLTTAHGIPVPRLYASGPGWLVLEAVEGTPLWQSGDFESWKRAALWASRLHRGFDSASFSRDHLLAHDRAYFEAIVRRAGVDRELAEAAERAIEIITSLPTTLIHGELYPANVLVRDELTLAVDWEMAAIGSGVIDLAALITGFHDDQVDEIVDSYGGCPAHHLAAARLLLALQWIGWCPGWEAPEEHGHDWPAEARAAARELMWPAAS